MSDKMRIWDRLAKTDPKQTKPFKRAGGFSGTALKPIWTIKRLTEEFGPAGLGWGMHKPEFQTIIAGDEILCFCTVGIWYREDANTPPLVVYGVGGDKVLGKNKYGLFTNDEAFKAAYTDAMSNAMKQIGVGADIHMGLFDDDKYVAAATRDFASSGMEGRNPPNEQTARFPADADVERLAKAGAARASDGSLLSTHAADVAEKAKGWADAAISSINLAGNAMGAITWARAADEIPKGKKKSPLQWLEDNAPDQFARVNTAYTNVTGESLRQ